MAVCSKLQDYHACALVLYSAKNEFRPLLALTLSITNNPNHRLEKSRSQCILWFLEELRLPYSIITYKRDPKIGGNTEGFLSNCRWRKHSRGMIILFECLCGEVEGEAGVREGGREGGGG